jgi:hypothetical protein
MESGLEDTSNSINNSKNDLIYLGSPIMTSIPGIGITVRSILALVFNDFRFDKT